ncbi:hypothetical protein F8S12_38440 [Nostoc sp. WHI]|nr:hypothetical protein [Nostoc sp. WHI]
MSKFYYTLTPVNSADFSRYLENLSLNLSSKRRETLNFPPSRVGKGVRGLGFSWAFPHNVKSQVNSGNVRMAISKSCDRKVLRLPRDPRNDKHLNGHDIKSYIRQIKSGSLRLILAPQAPVHNQRRNY